jgi:hypothetical protein
MQMVGSVKRQLSYANVMATVAVFVALGGGAYAAKVAKNSVGASQIKKNGVGASEINQNAVGSSETAANSVGSSEVIDDSLLGADISEQSLGQVPAADTLDGLDSSAFQRAGADGLGRGTAGTVAAGADPVLFELAEGTLVLDCGGTGTAIGYTNDSGAIARVYHETGIHSDDDGGGIDIAVDGLEDVNPGHVDVADTTTVAIPIDGGVASGARRSITLAVQTDQHVAFVDAYVDFAGGNCSYLAELGEYGL